MTLHKCSQESKLAKIGPEARAKADTLENRIARLLKQQEYDRARDEVLAAVPEAVSLTKVYVPDEALPVLNAQKRCGWPNQCVWYCSKKEITLKKEFGKKWDAELDLLCARNPRKAERLWSESRQKIEAAYHASFNSRGELAAMMGIHRGRIKLMNTAELLREAGRKRDIFRSFGEEEPGLGWEETTKWYEENVLSDAIEGCALTLAGLLRDMARPEKLFARTTHVGDGLSNDMHEEESFMGFDDFEHNGHRWGYSRVCLEINNK